MEGNPAQHALLASQHAKVHKEMCRRMGILVYGMIQIFPDLEAVRPGCREGMQALSVLRLSLEKGKSLLQYCSNSSKLYLAMTGESLMHKFERIRLSFDENLKHLAAIVSQNLVKRMALVLDELNRVSFYLDPADKELGEEIISLLLSKRPDEKEVFNSVATKLGIISPKTFLEEQKALSNLFEKAQREGDNRKKSILSYLIHLLKRCSMSIKCNSSNSFVSKKVLLSTNSLDCKDLRDNKATNKPVRVVCCILELLKVNYSLTMIRAAVSIVMIFSYVDCYKEVGLYGEMPFLAELDAEKSSCISDALITLFNLSTVANCILLIPMQYLSWFISENDWITFL